MQHTIIIGADVRCHDGKVGTVAGVVINPNRNDVDYVILNPGLLGGREYYVPRGRIEWGADSALSLPCTQAELDALPRPTFLPEQGTVQDNLGDLCMARTDMPIRDSAGAVLGTLHGLVVDGDAFVVQAIILDDAPDKVIPIERIARYSDADEDALEVYLARETIA